MISPLPIDIKLNHNEDDEVLKAGCRIHSQGRRPVRPEFPISEVGTGLRSSAEVVHPLAQRN